MAPHPWNTNPEAPPVCLLRQMLSASESQVPADVVKAFVTPAERACRVGQCLVRGLDLIRYHYAVDPAPHEPTQKVQDLAAPDCAVFDC